MPTFAIEILFHARAADYEEAIAIEQEVARAVGEVLGMRAKPFPHGGRLGTTITAIDPEGEV